MTCFNLQVTNFLDGIMDGLSVWTLGKVMVIHDTGPHLVVIGTIYAPIFSETTKRNLCINPNVLS